MAATANAPAEIGTGLKKTVGFWGLMFVSLGSIIGSGWLLGALNAAGSPVPPRSSRGCSRRSC